MMNKLYVQLAANAKKLGSAAVLLAALSPFGAINAHAQTAANADTVYNGWLNAYLVRTGGKTYFTNSLTDRGEAFMWGQAYMITGVEDAYDRNHAADRKQLISDLLDTYLKTNTADISWDSWNDDIAWAAIALIRGYQITGNTTYLNAATQAWNMAYNRGWDNTFGGGIWENMADHLEASGNKGGLSNWTFVIAGAAIYHATGNNDYLTKSQAIYAWARANCFDTTTGRVYEGVGYNGRGGDDNAYNSGLIVNAANSLYRLTGNAQYFNDATLAATHVINKYPVLNEDHPANGDFGGDQFYRGLANFARDSGNWNAYYTWLNNNATAAWNHRRTDSNITWNVFTAATPTGNVRAMEAEGSVVVQAVTAQSGIVSPVNFSGNYEIRNQASGLSLTVAGASKANSAAIVQQPFNGGNESLWKLVPTNAGYYHIINVNSDQSINVAGNKGSAGANVVQWPAQGMIPGNDQWLPVQNSDGTYTFYNLYSQQVLDNFGASGTAGNVYGQWFSNGTNAQKFQLIPQGGVVTPKPAPLYSGIAGKCLDNANASNVAGNKVDIWDCNQSGAQNWVINTNGTVTNGSGTNGTNTNLCLDIANGATANGTLVQLWTCNGGPNQQWAQTNGTLYNTVSGKCLDDPANSTTNGTQLDIWDCNGGANQQWTATPPKSTSVKVAINAGGAAQSNSAGGDASYVADQNFVGGSTATTGNTISTANVTNAAPQAVYQSERYGTFSYTLPGLTAGTSYSVILHFAEFYWTQAGQRVFNVSINNTPVLTNYDIVAKAGINKAVVETFTATANSSGQIVVNFTVGRADQPKISGIEIK